MALRDKTTDITRRNKIIEEHYGLLRTIARRIYLITPACIEMEDLMAMGVFGLMDAIEGYDESNAAKFASYASWRIRGAILDGLRHEGWFPRGDAYKDMKIISWDGLSWSFEDGGFNTRQSRSGVWDWRKTAQDDRFPPPSSEMENREARKDALEPLTPLHKRVVKLYYFDGLNMKEIGKKINRSESRICQIITKALSQLSNTTTTKELCQTC